MRRFGTIICLLFYSMTCHGQITDQKNNNYYIDLGIGGFTTFNNLSGGTYYIGINRLTNSTHYAMRYRRLSEGSIVNFGGPSPSEEYGSIGLMFGKGSSKKSYQSHFLGGLGVTGGITRGKYIRTVQGIFGSIEYYEKEKFLTPSIPLEIGFLVKPSKNLGIGITLFGDLNLTRSYFGIALNLSLGKFE